MLSPIYRTGRDQRSLFSSLGLSSTCRKVRNTGMIAEKTG
jgi:hypothetical protein